ncbi:hypothetical protein ABZU75_25405 [Streptosporangium sp. NPDC005286]|uniref:hypothetical protein n=1 Tax=Streptosporangium sp. NPDC005286 TaxID=3154463 RepID=UPI0033B34909
MNTRKKGKLPTRVEIMQRDYLPSWYATRGRRRLLASAVVLATSLLWVDAAISWAVPRDDRSALAGLALLAIAMVVYLPAVTLLNVATRGVVELRERDLDERQVGERLRTVAIAHRVTTGILVALATVAIGVGIARGRDHSLPWDALVSVTIALFLTHFVLPLIISGWRLPDPPNDDD